MKCYDIILNDTEEWGKEYNSFEDYAKDFLYNFDFSENEITNQDIKYYKYICSYQGIKLYYDFGANYYFFAID